MFENIIKSQIENTIRVDSGNYNCVVYDNDLDLAATALCDYINSYSHIFNDKILSHLKIAYNLIVSLYPKYDGDIVEQFSVIITKKKGVNNDR